MASCVWNDPELARHPAARAFFGLLCNVDVGRGCWARRETLAKMAGLQKSSVDRYMSLLSSLGYITVRRRRQKTAKVFVKTAARIAAGFPPTKAAEKPVLSPSLDLYKGAKPLHSISDKKKEKPPTLEQQPLAQPEHVATAPDAQPVVVVSRSSDPAGQTEPLPQPQSLDPRQRQHVAQLANEGVTHTKAVSLVSKSSFQTIHNALKVYEHGNPRGPGYLIRAIENGWTIPRPKARRPEAQTTPPTRPDTAKRVPSVLSPTGPNNCAIYRSALHTAQRQRIEIEAAPPNPVDVAGHMARIKSRLSGKTRKAVV